MDAHGVDPESSEPVPRTNAARSSVRLRRPVGEVRLPIAGPYRPIARLYRLSDGRLLWVVRLWEVDRPVPRVVSTNVLRTFARRNRLPGLAAAIEEAVGRAVRGRGGR